MTIPAKVSASHPAPTLEPGFLRGRPPVASTHARTLHCLHDRGAEESWVTVSCPFFLQENLEEQFSLSGDSGFFR